MRNGNPKGGRGYSDVVWRPKEGSGIGALPARRALLSCLCGFKCFLYIVACPPNGLPGPPTSINHDAARRGGDQPFPIPPTFGREGPARKAVPLPIHMWPFPAAHPREGSEGRNAPHRLSLLRSLSFSSHQNFA